MAKPPTFTIDAFAAIHSSASALFNVGAIDTATMGEFAATCLAAPAPFTAADQTAA
jgi:putative transcriptional regulator